MEQLQIKKRITGTGFYLDEIEFLIFLIWLEKHNKVMMSDTTPVDVREFYAKCYRDGKIKDFHTAEVLANKEDCALIGNCIAYILNEELPSQLQGVAFQSFSRNGYSRPCVVMISKRPVPKKLELDAVSYMEKTANALITDCELVCSFELGK